MVPVAVQTAARPSLSLIVIAALADATQRDDEEWHAWNGSDEELELYSAEHSRL